MTWPVDPEKYIGVHAETCMGDKETKVPKGLLQ